MHGIPGDGFDEALCVCSALANSIVCHAIPLLGKGWASAFVEHSFKLVHHVFPKSSPCFAISRGSSRPLFDGLLIESCVGLFNHCEGDRLYFGVFSALVSVGKEEHLYLLDVSEHDLDWDIAVHWVV